MSLKALQNPIKAFNSPLKPLKILPTNAAKILQSLQKPFKILPKPPEALLSL